MDKIIIAHFINVDNRPQSYISEMLEEFNKRLGGMEADGIINFVYPVYNQETRVECINPKLITEDKYKEIKSLLEQNKILFENIFFNI